MTTKTPTTVEELERQLAQAQATADKAQAAAQAARERAEAERAERLRAYDRDTLDRFDDEALGQQIRDAQRALDEAVAASTLGRAWVHLKVTQLRRAHLSGEAAAIAARLGDPRRVTLRTADSTSFEDLGRAVDRVSESIAADEIDALEQSRQAAAEG